MSVKLSSKLPAGDANGLAQIAGALVKLPHNVRVIVALVDCPKVVTDHDSGAVIPTIRVRRCEVVRKQDLPQAEQLLRRALEERTGETVLPLELEDEISEAFKDFAFEESGEGAASEDE